MKEVMTAQGLQLQTPQKTSVIVVTKSSTPLPSNLPPTRRPKLTHQSASLDSLRHRTDPAGLTLRQQHAAVSSLSDDEVFEASLRAGLTHAPPSNAHILMTQKADPLETEKLREQLADFNAFTEFMTSSNPKILNSDTLLDSHDAELWVRKTEVSVHRNGTGLGEADDGVYKWVFWRDLAGVIRSSIPSDGNSMVKTYRATRWPTHVKRWINFSFNGRDAQKPWERHRYIDLLSRSSVTVPGFEDPDATNNEIQRPVSNSSESSNHSLSLQDFEKTTIINCDEFRASNRYSVLGEDFRDLQPLLPIKDPETLSKMAEIRRRSQVEYKSDRTTTPDSKERIVTAGHLWLDGQTMAKMDTLRRAHKEIGMERSWDMIPNGLNGSIKSPMKPKNRSSILRENGYAGVKPLIGTAEDNQTKLKSPPTESRTLPFKPHSLASTTTDPNLVKREPTPTSSRQLSIPTRQTPPKIFLGEMENRNCTLLRVETIEALRLYSQHDFYGFMDMIDKHKSIITLDIRNNLNRGPIFDASMVGYAIQKLLQSSLEEYLPLEALKSTRDIMYHYLANRNLKRHVGVGMAKWKPVAFDTKDFNAMNYLSEEYSDGFFQECQEIIKCGYGNTMSERCITGAALSAVLYSACLSAMDVADKDNAVYAQNLVRAVGIIYNAAETLVLGAPVPYLKYLDTNLLKPLATEITNKIQNRYSSGALQQCVVSTFRDTYCIGALRGERIPGMANRHEEDIKTMQGDERTKFEGLMKKRREIGNRFVGLARMYVSALGEQWPKVNSVKDVMDNMEG